MSRNELNQRGFSNFGFSTILISFVMICIIIFCALALLTANSDYKLSRKVADRSEGYYQAKEEAYQYLSDIDEILAQAYLENRDETAYYRVSCQKLTEYAALHDTMVVTQDAADQFTTVAYTIPISDSQKLCVKIHASYPPSSDGVFYKLTQWQTITDIPVDDDTTLNLLGT